MQSGKHGQLHAASQPTARNPVFVGSVVVGGVRTEVARPRKVKSTSTRVGGHPPQKCYQGSMLHPWQPSIEQPMFRNVGGILKDALPLFPKPLTSLRAAAHSRRSSWATSRALTTNRRSASVQSTNTPIFPTSDSALQQLIDSEGRILR